MTYLAQLEPLQAPRLGCDGIERPARLESQFLYKGVLFTGSFKGILEGIL